MMPEKVSDPVPACRGRGIIKLKIIINYHLNLELTSSLGVTVTGYPLQGYESRVVAFDRWEESQLSLLIGVN